MGLGQMQRFCSTKPSLKGVCAPSAITSKVQGDHHMMRTTSQRAITLAVLALCSIAPLTLPRA
jgi:hypothetical protein